MLSTLRATISPGRQLCAAILQQVRVTPPVCAQSTTATPPGGMKDFFASGKQRFLTQYLSEAFAQEDPDLEYHDVSRGDHDFSSCDYLALAENDELNRVEGEFIRDYGRITFNRSAAYPRNAKSLVTKFEHEAAAWLGAADCLMTNSGTEANVNTLQLILCENLMPIYIDKYAHATFVLGARASGRNDPMYFKHNNVNSLLALVKAHGPGLVCIDTVYSALGTIAPIEEIVDVCNKYDCILVADEAHAIGILGEEGGGLVQSKGLEKEVPFRTTSFGKAIGSGSGLIMFNESTVEGKKLIGHLSSMPIFSLAPQECAAVRNLKGMEMIRTEPWRREELHAKTKFFREGAIKLGYDGLFVRQEETNIIPFVVGPVNYAKNVYDMLVKAHIYASPHFYPASPRSKSVVRFTVCNFLRYDQIQYLHKFMEEIKPIVKPWEWPDQDPDVFNMGFQKV